MGSAIAQTISQTAIQDACQLGKADSDPPSQQSGQQLSDMFSQLTGENYLYQYYNQNDLNFTSTEQQQYTIKVLPFGWYFYLLFLAIILWIMYLTCIFCKCCYCFGGPATKVQSKKRKICPIILLGIFGLLGLVASPYCIYFSNLLQSNVNYQFCVTKRWSGAFYYGYDLWEGQIYQSNSTQTFLQDLTQTSGEIDSIFQPLIKNEPSQIKEIPDQLRGNLTEFLDIWKDYPDISNINYGQYSEELPQYYSCSLCSSIQNYNTQFSTELDSFTVQFTQDLGQAIESVYNSYINPLQQILNTTQTNLAWIDQIKVQFDRYENNFLKEFIKVNSNQFSDWSDIIFGYNLTVLCLSAALIILQGLTGVFIWFGKLNWRAALHVGWCLHSCVMIFRTFYLVLLIGGVMVSSAFVLHQSCEIFTILLQDGYFSRVFVKNKQDGQGGEGIQFCYQKEGDLPSFLNITGVLAFIDNLQSDFQTVLDHNFNRTTFKYQTIQEMDSEILNSVSSVFVSKENTAIYWQGNVQVNFFLNNKTQNQFVQQQDYMVLYCHYYNPGYMETYCGESISKDYWVYSNDECPDGYTYLWKLQPTLTTTQDCYAISEVYSQEDIYTRYDYSGIYDSCVDVDSQTYKEVMIEIWQLANNSFTLDIQLNEILVDLKADYDEFGVNVNSSISYMDSLYGAVETTISLLKDIGEKRDVFYQTLNCTMIRQTTDQLKLGFCGDYLYNLFYLGVATGFLGGCHMFLSMSAIFIYFRFRTDLEIEKESMLRKIGWTHKQKQTENVSADISDTISITERSEIIQNKEKYNKR